MTGEEAPAGRGAWRPGVLFPGRPSGPGVLAAVAGWLGVLLLMASIGALAVAVLTFGTETDHGAGGFAAGGLLAAVVLLVSANLIARLEGGTRGPVRLLGAAALAAAAGLGAFYPLQAIRDPGSFAAVAAVIVGALGMLALVAAWSFVRRR